MRGWEWAEWEMLGAIENGGLWEAEVKAQLFPPSNCLRLPPALPFPLLLGWGFLALPFSFYVFSLLPILGSHIVPFPL